MTSGERNTIERQGRKFSYPLEAGASINRGTMVVLAAGKAKAGLTAVNLICVGMAQQSASIAEGDEVVQAKLGTFLFANSTTDALADAHVGSDCFIEDDETVAATDGGGTRSRAGTFRGFEGGAVWVEFS